MSRSTDTGSPVTYWKGSGDESDPIIIYDSPAPHTNDPLRPNMASSQQFSRPEPRNERTEPPNGLPEPLSEQTESYSEAEFPNGPELVRAESSSEPGSRSERTEFRELHEPNPSSPVWNEPSPTELALEKREKFISQSPDERQWIFLCTTIHCRQSLEDFAWRDGNRLFCEDCKAIIDYERAAKKVKITARKSRREARKSKREARKSKREARKSKREAWKSRREIQSPIDWKRQSELRCPVCQEKLIEFFTICGHGACLTCLNSWIPQGHIRLEQGSRKIIMECMTCRTETIFTLERTAKLLSSGMRPAILDNISFPTPKAYATSLDPLIKTLTFENYQQEIAKYPCNNAWLYFRALLISSAFPDKEHSIGILLDRFYSYACDMQDPEMFGEVKSMFEILKERVQAPLPAIMQEIISTLGPMEIQYLERQEM